MSTSSREESPDWIRNFQTPTKSALLLSSDSEPSSADRQLSEDEKDIYEDDEVSLVDKVKVEGVQEKKRKRYSDGKGKGKKGDRNIAKQEKSETPIKKKEQNHSIWTLSSDSESSPEVSPVRENNIYDEESMKQKIDQNLDREKDNATVPEDKLKENPKRKSPRKRKTEDQIPIENKKQNSHVKGENDGNVEVLVEESAKPVGPYASSSRLPLVLSEKVQRSKALVECEGDSIDLSGDVGAVGRVVISDDPTGNHDMFFDLKGTIYKTTIVPSRTFCVVSFGQSEAKIEAIMNDFIQLKPQSNVYEAETMVEGTLDGFSFDSEDEADNLPKAKTNQNDQNEDVEEQQKGKGKGKAKAESKSVAGRKQGKSAGGKPPKKVKKKAQVAKKTKAKK